MTEPTNNVNRVVFDLDFVQDAFNDLPFEQRNKENLVKMLIVFANRFDTLQKESIKMAYNRFIDIAAGPILEGVANRLFIERANQSDTALRGAIKLHALKQDSEGTRDQIVNILQIISGSESIEVVKRPNKYVEVVFPNECLSLIDIKIELEDLFPVDTNLVLGDVVTGEDPFGFYSVGDTVIEDGLGVFGSTADSTTIKSNSIPVIVISNEGGI